MTNRKSVQSRRMVKAKPRKTDTGPQNKTHKPRNQDIQCSPEDKAMLETQNVSMAPSVRRSSSRQSWGQLHVVATGMRDSER